MYLERMPSKLTQDPDSHYYFPFNVDDSGACENLQEDGKCKIYDERPKICRTEDNMRIHREQFGGNRQDYFAFNAAACKVLIRKEGMDESLIPKV